MRRTRPVDRAILRFALAFCCAATAAGTAPARAADDMRPPLTDDQRIVHALNRLGFGPRPGDVERVKKVGLNAWVRQQLRPDQIPDPAVEKALAPLDTLTMDTGYLIDQFYGDVKFFLQLQAAAGNTEEMKMRFGLDLDKSKSDKSKSGGAKAADDKTADTKKVESKDGEAKPYGESKPAFGLAQIAEFAKRDGIRAIAEQQQAKLMRAALSERQLQEVMVDFWTNHFNVDVRKDAVRALQVEYDRDVIRPRVLGRFRDLLGATAHSGAMLAYLNNNENSVARKRNKAEQMLIEWYVSYKFGYNVSGQIPAAEGPNENYGRELLELHTLGVDGGYTQKDVQEVARCFSGWSSSPLNGKFSFDAKRHDQGEKIVLGQTFPPNGGVKDGERVLDLLAKHPSTAKFISRKLCQRFVADDPPAGLVERVAAVYSSTDGDIRKMVEAIVTSDEFYSPAAARAKVKSPFEYAASAVRATAGEFTSRGWGVLGKLSYVGEGGALLGNDNKASKAKKKTLNRHVHDMGQPLLAYAAPTGYPETGKKWVSPGALIDRLNFATALAENDVTDVKVDVRRVLGKGVDADDPEAVIDRLAGQILHQPLSPATRKTLLKSLNPEGDAKKTISVKRAAALILGSPEFQRR